uniref:DUF4218 domain-containing protein n=1 Tax=Nicotiana tabacum TaxID=4097 RepID=A0A1S3YSW3_TOBAC|nr:PREDICTED: uncharacterized protein LOC107779400 [Nicotiana tabacum]
MVHLPIHLARKEKLGGPAQFRWMYPFERYLRTQKSYVRNNAHPEGSIAEGYLAEESLTFCSRYLKNMSTKFNKPARNDDGSMSYWEMSIFKKSGQKKKVVQKASCSLMMSSNKHVCMCLKIMKRFRHSWRNTRERLKDKVQ